MKKTKRPKFGIKISVSTVRNTPNASFEKNGFHDDGQTYSDDPHELMRYAIRVIAYAIAGAETQGDSAKFTFARYLELSKNYNSSE